MSEDIEIVMEHDGYDFRYVATKYDYDEKVRSGWRDAPEWKVRGWAKKNNTKEAIDRENVRYGR